MKVVRTLMACCLAILLAAPSGAQTNVMSQSSLEKAIQARVAQDQADRQAIRTLLQRKDVRDVASKAGLSIEKAEAAVATLQGDDLRDLAAQARHVENGLAGGATVVITTTTIIIILLLVIILVLVAD